MRLGVAIRYLLQCTAGSQLRCCAAILFFIFAAFLLGWPSLAFHHSEYARALHAEDEASFPMPITKVFGVLRSVALDPSYRVDEVAVGVVDARGALHVFRRQSADDDVLVRCWCCSRSKQQLQTMTLTALSSDLAHTRYSSSSPRDVRRTSWLRASSAALICVEAHNLCCCCVAT